MNLWINSCCAWLRQQTARAGAAGYVVGISGGIDSAVAAKLACLAVGEQQVIGLWMPFSSWDDRAYADTVRDWLGCPMRAVFLERSYEELKSSAPAGNFYSPLQLGNVKARMRMTTLYAYANFSNRLVLGTGNKTELMLGYFTKYGDGGVDVLPLGDLLKYQVCSVARILKVPQEIIDRPPSAGLWAGQTDEAEIGIPYHRLDQCVSAIEHDWFSHDRIDPGQYAKVYSMWCASEHKRETPPIFKLGER